MERNIYKIGKELFITSDEEIKEGNWVIENHTFKREPYIGKCFYPKNDGTVTDEVLKRDLLSVNYKGHYETLALKQNCKKIILTTNQELIKDGVQAIDDKFLEWFVKNHTCEFVEVDYDVIITQSESLLQHQGSKSVIVPHHINYKIIIPQEEPKCLTKLEIAKNIAAIGIGKEEPKQETLEEAARTYGWRIKVNTFSDPVKTNDLANSAIQDFTEGAKWQAEQDKNK